MLKGAIRRNELSCKTDIVKEMDWRRRSKTFTDTDFNNIMLRMEKLYGITRDKNIKRAIDIVGNNNHYHPIIDKLESLGVGWSCESKTSSSKISWDRGKRLYLRGYKNNDDGSGTKSI